VSNRRARALGQRPDGRVPAAKGYRRRPSGSGSLGGGSRPDRIAAWAFLLGVFLIALAAMSARAATGGAELPGGEREALRAAPLSEQLGRTKLSPGSTGEAVATLQRILSARRFGQLQVSGRYEEATQKAVLRFQNRAGLRADGVVGPNTRPALLRLMTVRTATWYGPGFYGSRAACGIKLRRSTLGVAHKTLPCGTKVTFYSRGRFVTVPVIDRGPFVRGVSWDLSEAAARRLATLSTARVRSLTVEK
jgi:hypothetical protein